MNLLTIENELIKINAERAEATTAYEKIMHRTITQIQELNRQREMALKGIDLVKIGVAEFILEVRGLNSGQYSERCVLEAIKDIASGTNKMRNQYFGVKNYAHWTHQECDCEYGMGPTHGSIVFSVGYARGIRGEDITDAEKEDCIYYLNLLKNKEYREAIKANKVTA